jgi:hypothetical protein
VDNLIYIPGGAVAQLIIMHDAPEEQFAVSATTPLSAQTHVYLREAPIPSSWTYVPGDSVGQLYFCQPQSAHERCTCFHVLSLTNYSHTIGLANLGTQPHRNSIHS